MLLEQLQYLGRNELVFKCYNIDRRGEGSQRLGVVPPADKFVYRQPAGRAVASIGENCRVDPKIDGCLQCHAGELPAAENAKSGQTSIAHHRIPECFAYGAVYRRNARLSKGDRLGVC